MKDKKEEETEEDRNIFTLVSSGLANFPDANGNLPPGTTHILYMENGRLKVKRVCFS
jgi:hypothetical protein